MTVIVSGGMIRGVWDDNGEYVPVDVHDYDINKADAFDENGDLQEGFARDENGDVYQILMA